MSIDNFNIVLLGDNFPVSSIDLDDFRFMGKPLRQSLRVPVALQAETEGFQLQVLPDRFEVGVAQVADLETQAEEIMRLAETFLEYAGRRTVRAVGHNCQRRFADTSQSKTDLYAALVHTDRVDAFLQSTVEVTADLSFYFRRGEESRGRVLVSFAQPDSILLDFNFHFDLQVPNGTPPATAIRQLPTSLEQGAELVDRFGQLGVQGEIAR